MAKGKESRSLFDSIKNDINKSSGGSFANFFSLRESGAKCRVRFLDDFEDGLPVVFHDKWNGFNHPCLKQYGKECPNCDNPEGRTGTVYYWNIYNYETKKVELFGYKANKASPIPGLLSVFEMLGDITSQDLIVQRNGTGTGTTYTVLPTGKEVEFKKEAKLFTEKKILKLLFDNFKNYGDDEDDDDYDEEETVTTKRKSKSKSKAKPKYEEDDEDYDFDDDEDEDEYEDEEPAPPKKSKSKSKAKRKPEPEDEEEDEDDDDLPFDLDEDEDEDEEEELPPPRKKKKSKRK